MQLIRAENNYEKTASFQYSSFETVKVGMTRKTEELPPPEKLFFFFVFSTLLPLNFNIYIQILQTHLQTFLEGISEEKWQKDQSVYILFADHFANSHELFP